MTFLEKLREDRPKAQTHRIVENHCPYEYGYEEYFECEVDIVECPNECEKCWNREMPEEPSCDDVKKAYEQGLTDAWELAKRISLLPSDGGYNCDTLREVFGTDLERRIYKFTPQEAMAKLKAYEDSKIEVGDVVCHREYGNGIVTREDGDFYNVVCANGDVICFEKNRVTKTGKHIEIKAILEQIGE